MLANRIGIIQHVLTTLYIYTNGQHLYLDQAIISVIIFLKYKYVTDQPLVENQKSTLFLTYMDQVVILRQWHQIFSIKNQTFNKADIIDNLNETEWKIFCNNYISHKAQNAHTQHTKTGSTM